MCDSLSGSVWILEYCELTVTFDHENLTLHLRVQVIFFAMFKYLKNGTNGHLKTRQLWAQLFLTSGHKNTGIGGFCLVWHFFLLYEDFRIKAQNIETEQRVKKQSETKDFFHINKSLKTKRSPPGTAEPFEVGSPLGKEPYPLLLYGLEGFGLLRPPSVSPPPLWLTGSRPGVLQGHCPQNHSPCAPVYPSSPSCLPPLQHHNNHMLF